MRPMMAAVKETSVGEDVTSRSKAYIELPDCEIATSKYYKLFFHGSNKKFQYFKNRDKAKL